MTMSMRSESRAAADKLLAYLASEYDPNGTSRTAPNNIQFYYKMPAVFAYTVTETLPIALYVNSSRDS